MACDRIPVTTEYVKFLSYFFPETIFDFYLSSWKNSIYQLISPVIHLIASINFILFIFCNLFSNFDVLNLIFLSVHLDSLLSIFYANFQIYWYWLPVCIQKWMYADIYPKLQSKCSRANWLRSNDFQCKRAKIEILCRFFYQLFSHTMSHTRTHTKPFYKYISIKLRKYIWKFLRMIWN